MKTNHPIQARKPERELIKKRKAVNDRILPDKYLDLARKQKKLWIMKMTVIPIIIGALRIIPRDLEKRLVSGG